MSQLSKFAHLNWITKSDIPKAHLLILTIRGSDYPINIQVIAHC